MKFKILFPLLAVMALFGCAGNDNKNIVPNNQPTFERAVLAAQDLVKIKFAGECVFLPDAQGGETHVPGRYKVLQKFTSTRYGSYEVPQNFVYKVFIELKGSDATSPDDWEFTELIIENMETGGKEIYKPNEIPADVNPEPRQVRFAGVMLNVVEETPNYIRLSTSKRLSHGKLKAAAKEIKNLFSSAYFHVEGKTDRGEEYAAIQGNNLFDYDNKESISTIEWTMVDF